MSNLTLKDLVIFPFAMTFVFFFFMFGWMYLIVEKCYNYIKNKVTKRCKNERSP